MRQKNMYGIALLSTCINILSQAANYEDAQKELYQVSRAFEHVHNKKHWLMPLRKLPQLPLPQYQYQHVIGTTGGILTERSLEARLLDRTPRARWAGGLGADMSAARVKSPTQTIIQKNKYDLEQMD